MTFEEKKCVLQEKNIIINKHSTQTALRRYIRNVSIHYTVLRVPVYCLSIHVPI